MVSEETEDSEGEWKVEEDAEEEEAPENDHLCMQVIILPNGTNSDANLFPDIAGLTRIMTRLPTLKNLWSAPSAMFSVSFRHFSLKPSNSFL